MTACRTCASVVEIVGLVGIHPLHYDRVAKRLHCVDGHPCPAAHCAHHRPANHEPVHHEPVHEDEELAARIRDYER